MVELTSMSPESADVLALQNSSLGSAPLSTSRTSIDPTAELRAEVEALRRQNAAARRQILRMNDALASARALHLDLCTSDMPSVEGLEIEVLFRPAEAVGGDAYGAVRLGDSRVAFFVIDATGHGVAASLLAAYAQQAFRRALRDAHGRPVVRAVDILHEVNRALWEANLSDCQFVAASAVIYDESSGLLCAARGGAPHPLVVSSAGTTTTIECSGPLLGALENPDFREVATSLQAGDTLVLHSDGLNEVLAAVAEPTENDISGTAWVRSLPVREAHLACRELDDLRLRRSQCDDLTVVMLRAHQVADPPDPA